MYDEMKAQLAINQQMIQETNMSFKERVISILNPKKITISCCFYIFLASNCSK